MPIKDTLTNGDGNHTDIILQDLLVVYDTIISASDLTLVIELFTHIFRIDSRLSAFDFLGGSYPSNVFHSAARAKDIPRSPVSVLL